MYNPLITLQTVYFTTRSNAFPEFFFGIMPTSGTRQQTKVLSQIAQAGYHLDIVEDFE